MTSAPLSPLTRYHRQRVSSFGRAWGVKATLEEAPSLSTIDLQDYQRPPAGDWRTWALKTARGTGKNVAASSLVVEHLREVKRGARVAIGAPTREDAVVQCAEGATGLITLFGSEFPYYSRTKGEARHYLGGYVRFMGCEKPARWHGGNWSMRWIDEAPFCNFKSITEGDFALRLGDRPRSVFTMTPFNISRRLKDYLDGADVVTTRASIRQNKHISPRVLADLEAKYGGTTLGRAFLEGLDVDFPEGAVWKMLGEEREKYLVNPPEEPRWTRSGSGADWGTSVQHVAALISGSVDQDGRIWIRRAWRSPSGSSRLLIEAAQRHKREIGIRWTALDRSQWSLADYLEDSRLDADGHPIGGGLVAIKGDRNVEWRVGLVLSALEQGRLFFDKTGDGVPEAYGFLTQYHRDDEGEIEEVEDDDADSLCYLVAELERPTVSLPAGMTIEDRYTREGDKRVDVDHFPPAWTPKGEDAGLELRGGDRDPRERSRSVG